MRQFRLYSGVFVSALVAITGVAGASPANAQTVPLRSYVSLDAFQASTDAGEVVVFQTEVVADKSRCWKRRGMRIYRKTPEGHDQLIRSHRTSLRGQFVFEVPASELNRGLYYARTPGMRTERFRCRTPRSPAVGVPPPHLPRSVG